MCTHTYHTSSRLLIPPDHVQVTVDPTFPTSGAEVIHGSPGGMAGMGLGISEVG